MRAGPFWPPTSAMDTNGFTLDPWDRADSERGQTDKGKVRRMSLEKTESAISPLFSWPNKFGFRSEGGLELSHQKKKSDPIAGRQLEGHWNSLLDHTWQRDSLVYFHFHPPCLKVLLNASMGRTMLARTYKCTQHSEIKSIYKSSNHIIVIMPLFFGVFGSTGRISLPPTFVCALYAKNTAVH